jgi:hypothetical protein
MLTKSAKKLLPKGGSTITKLKKENLTSFAVKNYKLHPTPFSKLL